MSEPGNEPTPVETPPQTDPSKDQPSGTGTPPVNNGGEPETLTLTTAQLAKRLDTEVTKALSRMFDSLGVKDATEAGVLLKKQRDAEAANKTELEKAQAEIERWKKEADQHKSAREKAEQERMEERRQSAILSALKDAKKPADMLILVNARLTEDVAGVMSEEGALDEKALKALIEKAKKEWPDQFGSSSPGSPSNAGGKVPQADKDKIRKSIRVPY